MEANALKDVGMSPHIGQTIHEVQESTQVSPVSVAHVQQTEQELEWGQKAVLKLMIPMVLVEPMNRGMRLSDWDRQVRHSM